MKYNYKRNRRLYIKPFTPSFNTAKDIVVSENIIEENTDINDLTINKEDINRHYEDNTLISIFGFDLELDDIIIIGLVVFLIFEKKIDYLLIIILALMLFDISIDTFKNLDIFKKISDYL